LFVNRVCKRMKTLHYARDFWLKPLFIQWLIVLKCINIVQILIFEHTKFVATPLWAKCENETHTPKSGNWESSGIPTTLELNNRGQNTLPWGVLYIFRKVLKRRCPKWPRMSHLDICSSSYGQKKGRESNWQFDSRPLKVGNRLLPDVYRVSETRHWKALKESYNSGLDLTLIGGRSREIWVPKIPGVQPETVLGLFIGSPGKKCHSDVAPTE